MATAYPLRYLRSPRFEVVVTAEIIHNSKRRDSAHCMIAEAVRHARPDATGISVDLQAIRFSEPQKRLRYIYLTPRPAQVALIDFDQGRTPEPFSMILAAGQTTKMGSYRAGRASQVISIPEKLHDGDTSELGHLRGNFRGAAGRLLTAIVAEHPDGMRREDLFTAALASGKLTRQRPSYFDLVLARLRKRGRLEQKGDLWFVKPEPQLPRKQLAPTIGHENKNSITGVIGGAAPPVSKYARRRGFGLRNFGAY